jgi:hypothetical protein
MPKNDNDLAWNHIRRVATQQVRLAAAAWTERRINEVLSPLQERFEAAITSGELLELEPEFESWVTETLDEARKIPKALSAAGREAS